MEKLPEPFQTKRAGKRPDLLVIGPPPSDAPSGAEVASIFGAVFGALGLATVTILII